MEKLEQSIIKTMAFFDIFSHPLTKEEIYHWLWGYNRDINFVDFINQLECVEQFKHFEYKQGFYFLPGREEIVDKRQRRVCLVEDKMKIAVRGITKLRWVPFVRAVFVCNTLAMGSVTDKSDIDVLVVARKKRVWLVRFLSNAVLKLFGLRTGRRGQKNKICLSFFVGDDSINLSAIRIENPDIYLIYWLSQLIPIYDPDDMRMEVKKRNIWAINFVPNGFTDFQMFSKYRVEDNRCSKIFKKIWEKMWSGGYGDFLESQARTTQMQKLKLRQVENKTDKSVIFDDNIIKLHENDRRVQYQEQWQENCERIIVF